MQEIVVKLGGKEYKVRPLRMAESRAWRKKFEQPFAQLAQTLAGAGEIELTDAGQVAGLVQTLVDVLIGSVDQLLDMLFEYAPELAADRERIEADAYDEEAMQAFVKVLQLAYPFGGLLKAFQPGPAGRRTSRN